MGENEKRLKREILELIFNNVNITRSDVLERLDLNRCTVYSIIPELIKKKFIVELDDGIKTRRRKKRFLKINPDIGYVIGINIDHELIEAGLFDFGINKIEGIKKEIILRHEKEENILKIISGMIRHLIKNSNRKNIYGIGIGNPGITKIETGKNGSVITDWRDINLKEYFEKIFNIPVYVMMKNNMAALYEYWLLREKNIKHLVYLNVSSGVGAGSVINGNIWTGGKGDAGNIGHMVITSGENGGLCYCGNRGCVATVISTGAIISKVEELIQKGFFTSLSSDNITFDEIARKFVERDKLVLDVVRDVAHYLGICISNIINTVSPDVIVIGGSIRKLGSSFEELLKNELERFLWVGNKKFIPEIIFSKSEENHIKGSAIYAIKEGMLFNCLKIFK